MWIEKQDSLIGNKNQELDVIVSQCAKKQKRALELGKMTQKMGTFIAHLC